MGINRRQLVGATLAAPIASLPLGLRRAGAAESRALKVGVLSDMQGVLADAAGPGSVVAARMAVERIGSKIGDTPIEVVVGDYQNKPDLGAAIAREWIDNQGVDVIVDVVTSPVALAVSDIVRDRNKTLLATGPGTTELTGARCSGNTVHWSYDNYMLASALSRALVAAGGDTWFFITVDFAFGHDLQRISSDLLASQGAKVVGSVLHPFNTTDYAPYLLQAQASGAKVIALANSGNDTVNAYKQLNEFGLNDGSRLVCAFLAPINTVHAVGLKEAQGLFATESFYWNADDPSREFGRAFFGRFKRMPNMAHAGAYRALVSYFDVVRDLRRDDPAASSDGRKVVDEMKRRTFDDPLFGNTTIRPNGRAVHGSYLLKVKSPEQSRELWDYYDVVRRLSGEETAPPLAANACPAARLQASK